jgi:hypothetical protein
MTNLTRNTLIATALFGFAAALPSQAAEASITNRAAEVAGQYLMNTGNAMLDQVRKELAAGMQPKLQRLPTVVVTPTDAELRDAGIDPRQFHAARKATR